MLIAGDPAANWNAHATVMPPVIALMGGVIVRPDIMECRVSQVRR